MSRIRREVLSIGFEIDYLPVGQKPEEKSGDAIAMRFWDNDPEESVILTIDGGTRESGVSIVEHIKEYYGTSKVHLAILTHPDADHASGVRDILEQMDVKAFLSLIPWEHSSEILPIVQTIDPRVTASSIEKRLKDAFPATVEAVNLARKKNIKVIEPFAPYGPIKLNETTQLYFIGPIRDIYLQKWLPTYSCLPTPSSPEKSLFERMLEEIISKTKTKNIEETWEQELLVEPAQDEVNSENNSSLIFIIEHKTHQLRRFFFCGDAGVPAIENALPVALYIFNIPSDGFNFFHVPHHGSRHNLGPSLLNQLFGLPKDSPVNSPKIIAFVSAKKDDPKHPSRRVTNALNRRGVKVIGTFGSAKLHHSCDSPDRGWSNADPIPFYYEVEEIEEE